MNSFHTQFSLLAPQSHFCPPEFQNFSHYLSISYSLTSVSSLQSSHTSRHHTLKHSHPFFSCVHPSSYVLSFMTSFTPLQTTTSSLFIIIILQLLYHCLFILSIVYPNNWKVIGTPKWDKVNSE